MKRRESEQVKLDIGIYRSVPPRLESNLKPDATETPAGYDYGKGWKS
jgi:hypothetical protein